MLLDLCDQDLSPRMRQRKDGYWVVGGGYERKYIHRIVLERKLGRKLREGELCDHINRNPSDNRRNNLRVGDKSLNTVNRKIRPDNKSGYTGVHLYWPKEYRSKGWSKSWRFVIQRKGFKTFFSKSFKTPEEAHKAREEKLKKYIY